jgi:hypothetical protein
MTVHFLQGRRYKDFVESFFNGLTAVRQAMQYKALLCTVLLGSAGQTSKFVGYDKNYWG